MRIYGMEMELPEGKLPGFYAQLVKALAERVEVFDRDKELLIVRTEEEAAVAAEVLKAHRIGYEDMDLLLLPEQAAMSPFFDDYGFISRSGRIYLYAHLCSVFRLRSGAAGAEEPEQAVRQMEEHLLAKFTREGEPHFAVDAQLEPLMQGIAKAYGCSVDFVRE